MLFERPADSFIADFIGETTLAVVTAGPDGPTVLGASLNGIEPPRTAARPLYLVLRPGTIEISPDSGREPDFLHFGGTVVRVIYEGESTLVRVDCGEGVILTARQFTRAAHHSAELRTGDPVRLRLHRRNLVLVPEADR
jgi:putative spermidine/putrescine transport system ATP-binding protein